jgi:hypothetical protein
MLVFDGKAIYSYILIFCDNNFILLNDPTYIFYSIYFNIQYNIELIFTNTSIIEYWFFSDIEHFLTELHPLLVVYFYCFI